MGKETQKYRLKPVVDSDDRWGVMYAITEAYLRRFHELPSPTTEFEGVHLGKWLSEQRWRADLGILVASHVQRLSALDALYAQLNPSSISILLDLAAKDDALKTSRRGKNKGTPLSTRKALLMKDVLVRTTDKDRTPMDIFGARINAVTEFYNETGKLPGKNNRDLKVAGKALDYWLYDLRTWLKDGVLSDEAVGVLSEEPWWGLVEERAGLTPTVKPAPVVTEPEPAPLITDPKPGDIIVGANGASAGIAIGDGKMLTDIGEIVPINGGAVATPAPALAQTPEPASVEEPVAEPAPSPSEELVESGVPARRKDGRFRPHTRSKLAEEYHKENSGDEVAVEVPEHIRGVDVYVVEVSRVVKLDDLDAEVSRHRSNGGEVFVTDSGEDAAEVSAAYLVTDLKSALVNARAFGYGVNFEKAGI
jgi:hypothetical protein